MRENSKHMFLIVGLGNPGEKFKETRHNVGFMVLDALEKCGGLDTPHILLKPQTFMNASGKAVKEKYRSDTQLIVIHDDIDLKTGRVKVSKNSRSAGHKGVESIIKEIGTQDFTRIRIGIQPEKGKPGAVEDFVLKEFTKKELPLLQAALKKSDAALELILSNKLERAMDEYNVHD